MKYLKRTKSGFSFIELILALAISAMVLAVGYSFYLSNIKTTNTTQTRSQLQYEGENFLRSISKNAMQSYGIKDIFDTNELTVSKIGGFNQINISKIVFSLDTDSTNNVQYTYNNDTKNVNISEDDGVTEKLLCSYVRSITISSLESGTSYQNTNGIKIIVNLSKDDIDYTLTDNLYFRNK